MVCRPSTNEDRYDKNHIRSEQIALTIVLYCSSSAFRWYAEGTIPSGGAGDHQVGLGFIYYLDLSRRKTEGISDEPLRRSTT